MLPVVWVVTAALKPLLEIIKSDGLMPPDDLCREGISALTVHSKVALYALIMKGS